MTAERPREERPWPHHHPKAPRKVVITCAVTGAIHTPTMSPHLPITADEIAEAAIGAHEAGAAIVHLHARDPKDGRPDQRPEAFEPFLEKIKQACDVVINITTGGAPTMLVEERLKPCAHFKPEVASLNMGSMNFGLYPMLGATGVQVRLGAPVPRGLRRAHLQEHLQGHREHPQHLPRQRHALRGRVLRHRPPLHAAPLRRPRADQAALLHPVGVRASSAGIGGHPEDVAHMRRTADRPLRRPVRLERARRGAQPDADRGRSRWRSAATCAWARGFAPGSARQARRDQRAAGAAARQIIEGLGLEVATPDEAREILHLKGGNNVNF
jgi:uncharacterized protein (DUF849 family)